MSDQTTVHLMRHGEVHNPEGVLYGRMPGYHLSDLGVQMAEKVAAAISDRDITHYCLRSCCGNCNVIFGTDHLITNVPKMPRLFRTCHLKVGDSGMEDWIPINQTLATVNQTLFIELYKNILHNG